MNRKEYNSCVDDYSDILYRFILKSTNDKYIADDIVQESYITLWENASLIDVKKVKSYLFTTAYRKMIDYYRRSKRVERLEPKHDNIAEENRVQFDTISQIENALGRLADVQRHIVLLRDYEGYSYQEIGEITSLSESQVKVYLFRARHKLRQFINKEELL